MKRNLGWLAFAFFLLFCDTAFGLPQRTYVASNGLDTNPCSRTSPCRNFQAAVNAVAAGGEVIALDSAGYGSVTISQSVSIVAPPGIYAGISVPAAGTQTGVLVNTSGENVVLRGLTINSIGGTYGVWVVNGNEVNIENCVISNFNLSPSESGIGVYISTSAEVSIVGSTIRGNWQGVVVGGYGARVNIANSQVLRSEREGIELNGGLAGTETRITISDTLVTGTESGSSVCIDNAGPTGATSVIEATRVVVNSCTQGIVSEAAGTGTVTVSNSTVTGNAFGFYQTSGVFQSLGNNQVADNTVDISGTITVIGGK